MLIHIESENSLQRVAGYCHDAIFDADIIKYDKTSETFSMPLTREAWEKAKRLWSLLFLHRWEIPKVASVLTLHDVQGVDIDMPDVQDVLVSIDYIAEESSIRIKGMIGANVCLRISSLRGTLTDTGNERLGGTKFISLGMRLWKNRDLATNDL